MWNIERPLAVLALVTMVAVCVSFNSGCSRETGNEDNEGKGDRKMAMTMESPAFNEGEKIPEKYTCSGPDVSPALKWSDPPGGTVELALIMDDPDAPVGTWNHWILYGLSPDTRELPEGVSKDAEAADVGAKQGVTSFGRPGYGGPCPPPGPDHRYFFKLYALDTKVDLPPGASLDEVKTALDGHVLDEAQLMGTFSR